MSITQILTSEYGKMLALWTKEDLERLSERLTKTIEFVESSGADPMRIVHAKNCIVKAIQVLDE